MINQTPEFIMPLVVSSISYEHENFVWECAFVMWKAKIFQDLSLSSWKIETFINYCEIKFQPRMGIWTSTETSRKKPHAKKPGKFVFLSAWEWRCRFVSENPMRWVWIKKNNFWRLCFVSKKKNPNFGFNYSFVVV